VCFIFESLTFYLSVILIYVLERAIIFASLLCIHKNHQQIPMLISRINSGACSGFDMKYIWKCKYSSAILYRQRVAVLVLLPLIQFFSSDRVQNIDINEV
jgi:hypothetical protein